MDTVAQQNHAFSLIYNNPHIIASIVDNHGDILYISKVMQKLGKNKFIKPQISTIFKNKALENFNKKVIQNQEHFKYIYTMQTSRTEFTLFNCSKYPIYENNCNYPVAVLTIQDQFKLIDLTKTLQQRKILDLHEIEQIILFCVSLHLSHGETFQFITSQYKNSLTFKEFKSYCNNLLKVFQVNTLKDIPNNDILTYCAPVLSNLLKDGLILTKAY